MDNILIEQSEKTPLIDFNSSTGDLILFGKSIPENATRIFEPVYNWVINYVKTAKKVTNLRLNLEFFNTATSIWIAKIVKALCSINDFEKTLIIHIYFSMDDFESIDNIKDEIIELTNPFIHTANLSVGYKIYATDNNGKILKESMVFV